MSITRVLFTWPLLNAVKLQLHRMCSSHVFNISDPHVQAYLKNLMLEHKNLYNKAKRTPEESKRLFEIKPIINMLEVRNNLHDNIEALSKRKSDDTDMMEMIKKEGLSYLQRMTDVDRDLQAILLEPKLTEGVVLLEVTAGAGDQEAMLFARELFEMYESYAKYKDWEVCIVSLEKSDIGGIRKASMFIEGVGVPELMKFETGVHRVHRKPDTDKDGRIHTSAVSVAVLSKPTDIEANIPDRDLVIETKRASGAGGEHLDITDNAVRVTHTPTGTEVECQEGTSQEKNEEIAIQKLRTVLWVKQKEEQTSNREREPQIGSSNSVRTYDYPEDVVMEHRKGGGIAHNLPDFMEGDYLLEQMQNNLLRIHRRHEFMEEINRLGALCPIRKMSNCPILNWSNSQLVQFVICPVRNWSSSQLVQFAISPNGSWSSSQLDRVLDYERRFLTEPYVRLGEIRHEVKMHIIYDQIFY